MVAPECHIGGGHALTCDAVDGVQTGAKVHLSVRPERLILSEEAGNGTSLRGTVTENIYIGTDITTMIDLEGGPKITVRASNTERGNKRLIEPGNPAFVTMETGAARLLVD